MRSMIDLMKSDLPLTPSQTLGPYFTIGLNQSENEGRLASPLGNEITGEGEIISITGRVIDGNGDPVPDALIEIRQADASGSFSNPGFFGLARSHTGENLEAKYSFITIKPGAATELEAPYISVAIYMRGLLTHVYTRLYFSDESSANEKDALLNQVSEARQHTLIAHHNESEGIYEFDIHMQGKNETVFFQL